MIAVDTNVLVYADREDMPQHEAAVEALRELSTGRDSWALPIFCVTEFLRVVSNPRLFQRPTPVDEAVAGIDALLESPSAHLLLPGDLFWRLLREAIDGGRATGNLLFDAQIVALCREHGATTLLTEDRDFVRFPGIRVRRLLNARPRGA